MTLEYVVKAPEGTPKKTIVYLHGYGSHEQDLLAFTGDLPADYLHLGFRAPQPALGGGFAWYDINWNNVEERIDLPQARQSLNAILTAIEEVKSQYNLSGKPVDLVGFSQGGVLAYALALKNPHLFQKVALLSTYPDEKLLADIPIDRKKLENLRFFISHGTDDVVIPLDWAKKGAELLYDHSAYFSFREYMHGHGLNQKNYLDLIEFLSK